MFLAVHSAYACRAGPKNRNRTRKEPAVAEKTEIYCACAMYRRGGTRSKTQTMIHTAESFWSSTVLMHVEQVRKIETGLEKSQRLPRKLRFILLVQCTGEVEPARKRKLRFTQQNALVVHSAYACRVGVENLDSFSDYKSGYF
jgi:hypothetical protein